MKEKTESFLRAGGSREKAMMEEREIFRG